MQIGGTTELYAVLGHPVKHTLSPLMHNAAFKELGLDAVYVPMDVELESLTSVLPAMAEMGFKGANITVPLKEGAYHSMDILGSSAELYGSVNTVSFTDKGLRGASTDGYGFIMGFREAFDGLTLQGLNVLVLGAGGAGRVVAMACAEAGADSIIIHNRTLDRAVTVCKEIETKRPGVIVEAITSPEDKVDAARQADVIVQTTSLGLNPDDEPAIEKEALRKGQILYDLVYNRGETRLVATAREAGLRASSGLGMLLHQGVRSFEIWTGQMPPVDLMRKKLEEALTCSN